jgi:hypothetical protein
MARRYLSAVEDVLLLDVIDAVSLCRVIGLQLAECDFDVVASRGKELKTFGHFKFKIVLVSKWTRGFPSLNIPIGILESLAISLIETRKGLETSLAGSLSSFALAFLQHRSEWN